MSCRSCGGPLPRASKGNQPCLFQYCYAELGPTVLQPVGMSTSSASQEEKCVHQLGRTQTPAHVLIGTPRPIMSRELLALFRSLAREKTEVVLREDFTSHRNRAHAA